MGWCCRGCQTITFRRPPDNLCGSCRGSRRGIHLKRGSKPKPKDDQQKSPKSVSKVLNLKIEHGVAAVSVGPSPLSALCVALPTSQPQPSPARPMPFSTVTSVGPGPCDYHAVRLSLEDLYRTSLLKIFDAASAHTICGKAHDIVAQFEQQKKPMPVEPSNGSAAVKALISIAAAVCREEWDMELWNRHCQLGKMMGVLQLRWMTHLPSSQDLAFVEDYKPAVRRPDLARFAALE